MVEIDQVGLEKTFKSNQCVSTIYLPLEKSVALHLNKIGYIPLPLYTLVKIGPVVLKKDFQKSSMYFSYYLPLENSEGLHLNKLESPSSKDALCQVWMKLTQWFWRRL